MEGGSGLATRDYAGAVCMHYLRGRTLFLAEKPCSTRLNAAEQVARLVANRSQIQTAIYTIDRRPNIDVSPTSGITGAAPSPRREFLRNFVLEQDMNIPKWIRCKRKIIW